MASTNNNNNGGAYNLPEVPIHTERKMRIIVIGAGPSGLCFAYKLQRSFPTFSLTVYDKNDQVGGTWVENTYPGCRCDVPSVTYTFSFEPRAEGFSSVYAPAAETRRYFQEFAERYGLGRYFRLGRKVIGARWRDDGDDEGGMRWEVQVEDVNSGTVVSDECDILISACGFLNAWDWPDIPGLHSFEGPLLHSANWDSQIDLTDKCVGLIGNGSSAIQILPSIQPIAKRITSVIRTPTWITPPFGPDQRTYDEDKRKNSRIFPADLLKHRKSIENRLNGMFPAFLADNPLQHSLRTTVTAQMKQKLNMAHLEDRLIPLYAVGARRLTPGSGYLEALGAANVEILFGGCERVTQKGIVADGREVPVDVLICATGFDTSYRPRYPIMGFEGKNLQHEWASEAKAYLGIAAPGFPNFMMFNGPNSPVGNGSLLPAIESQADYMLKLCNRWQTENIASFDPKAEATEDFCAHTDSFMKRTVWDQDSRSWYRKGSASDRNCALWPGSVLHYLEAMLDVRADDWNIKYRGNRLAWLGNGFSQTEVLPGGDSSYYLRIRDDSPFLSNAKRVKVMNGIMTEDRDETSIVAHEDGMPLELNV